MTPTVEKNILTRLERIEKLLVKIANPQVEPEPGSFVVDAEAIKALAKKVATHGKGVLHDFNDRRSQN